MENIQLSLFGKMSPVHSVVIMGMIFEPCLKKSQKPIFQCLQVENGQPREWFEGGQYAPLGECLTLNIGEYPNEESVSTLSEVLEAIVPKKYYLSPTACEGILRRAANRGKELPPILKKALEAVVSGAGQQQEEAQREESENCVSFVGGFPLGFRAENTRVYEEKATTICNGTRPGHCNGILYAAGFHGQNSITAAGVEMEDESVPTLTTKKNADVLCAVGVDTYNQCETGDKAKTLLATHQDADGLPCTVYALQGSMIGREDKNGPQGDGVNKNVCFTLNTTDRHAVVYALDRASFNQGANALYDFEITDSGINSTIVAKGPSAVAYEFSIEDFVEWIIRRLTPLECERLQGYPDNWTVLRKIKDMSDEEFKFWKAAYITSKAINGVKVKKEPTRQQLVRWYNALDVDGTRYKQMGNSLAIPCALRVIGYIADYIREGEAEE